MRRGAWDYRGRDRGGGGGTEIMGIGARGSENNNNPRDNVWYYVFMAGNNLTMNLCNSKIVRHMSPCSAAAGRQKVAYF